MYIFSPFYFVVAVVFNIFIADQISCSKGKEILIRRRELGVI